MKTKDRVLSYLDENGPSKVESISQKLKISRQFIHKVLNELKDNGLVTKMGQPPAVFYKSNKSEAQSPTINIPYDIEVFLKDNFIQVDATGNLLTGLDAMRYWCSNQQLPLLKTIGEFKVTREKYLAFFNEYHLIDGMQKVQSTKGLQEIGVDALYYLDFYAIERFGKTYLGTLMHYAKQGQNKKLMKMIVDIIKNRLNGLIDMLKIDAVVFVPPTIQRKVQIMSYLEKHLEIQKPIVKVQKIHNNIVIPQKALAKLYERVINAKNTFIVQEQPKYDHILILDDAIGSGATINEIALKIKHKGLANRITGIAITGSYKGFEVISEL